MFARQEYDKIRLQQPHPAALRHADIRTFLEELQAISPASMRFETLGESYEGREIRCAILGWGPVPVLLWSQMHGNEPTHTTVLLDLIHFLQRYSQHETANTILKGCTLWCIPMLNPDGAERYTRRNAQDIDINRDARQPQSPEGRILRDAVLRLRPHFAFNLHNQNRLTSTGGSKPQPATISLLVPPVDEADTQTLETQHAKRVAACFLEALPAACQDMVTRYDADYMPRCFGEWVQKQASSTVTVEAGGWPDGDPGSLGHAHFAGLVRALEAIADGSYLEASPEDYDKLRRSSEYNLFDVLISQVRVIDFERCTSSVVDLGINQQRDALDHDLIQGGSIQDLGDLSDTGGIVNLDGSATCCTPGRWVFRDSINPLTLPSLRDAEELLARGITGVIGLVDADDWEQVEKLGVLSDEKTFALNVGFLVRTCRDAKLTDVLTGSLRAFAGGALGVLGTEPSTELKDACEQFDLPLVALQKLTRCDSSPDPASLARLLDCADYARIGLQSVADLTLRKGCVEDRDLSKSLAGKVERVLIAGAVAYEAGQIRGQNLGRVLKRFSGD